MFSPRKHVVKRYGRAYQLRIETVEDVERIDEFGEHHWIATSAPVASFQCDPRFLAFLDYDENGRIRADEVIRAKRWMFTCLKNRSRLVDREGVLRLEDFDTATAEGRNLHTAAVRLLTNIGRDERSPITLADVRDKKKLLMQSGSNGDGVVPPESFAEPDRARYVRDIIETVGGVADLTGAKGVNEDLVKRFHAEAESYLAWVRQAELSPGETSSPILPLGEATAAAYDALRAVREKIGEFFSQCRLVRVDPASAGFLRLPEARLAELEPNDREALDGLAAQAPLQTPNAEETLRFDAPINPVYAERIAAFRATTLHLVFGRTLSALSRSDWREVLARFAPYEKWLSEKKGGAVEKLGRERLAAYSDGEHRRAVMRLIEEDKKVADELKFIADLERLLLYQRYFVQFLNNFVNLSELYDPNTDSMMDVGTVIMDGRLFQLVLRVSQRSAHVAVARNSGMFLMYLEVTRKTASDRFEAVCPVTRGRPDTLFVGKRGILLDRNGVEWDVKVVDIVRQPISVKQAALAPFRRAMVFIEGKVEGLSGTREKEWETGLGKAVEKTEKAGTEQVQAIAGASARQAEPSAASGATTNATGRRDLLIGGSIAVAALGSAWAFITKTLAQLSWTEIGLAFLASALIVLIPTSVVAILKLRRRNLASLLEADEWAINEQLHVSRRLAKLITQQPKFPKGTRKSREDMLLKAARSYREKLRSLALDGGSAA